MIRALMLSKSYSGNVVALDEVNLEVGSGQMIFLTGPSGSGKTTLLKLIMGAERPVSGKLTVLDTDISSASDSQIRALRRRMGVVFQDFKLLRGRSAEANISLGLRIAERDRRAFSGKAHLFLDAVGLADKKAVLVETMSWGEQQRVAIARALAREPELVLADEPTGNLDVSTAQRVMELFRAARNRGTTVIIATHDLRVVESGGGRVLHLSGGRLVEQGGVPDAV